MENTEEEKKVAYVKCPKCGTKINIDTYGMVNCSKCGYAVRAVAKKPAASQTRAQKQSVPPPPTPRPSPPPRVNTKKCRFCVSDIPEEATVCPYCRRKQTGGLAKKIIFGSFAALGFVFAALIILGILVGDDDKPVGSPSSQEDVVAKQNHEEGELFKDAEGEGTGEDDGEDAEGGYQETREPGPDSDGSVLQETTDAEAQSEKSAIDDFEYRIEGNTIYLIRYIGDGNCVELETSYIVDGVQYWSDISDFSAYGGYTKLIIHEGFNEVDIPIFNSCDVREVYFPKSMTEVYDYTLAYIHNEDGEKSKIYYAGTQDEWNAIFRHYERTKVEDAWAEKDPENIGRSIGDKLNEIIGVEYKPEEFEYHFSASSEELKQ